MMRAVPGRDPQATQASNFACLRFNSKLPHDKVLAVLEHLAEGCGVRQTARLVGVNKDTVTRLALLAGKHAKATQDELVAFSPRDP